MREPRETRTSRDSRLARLHRDKRVKADWITHCLIADSLIPKLAAFFLVNQHNLPDVGFYFLSIH